MSRNAHISGDRWSGAGTEGSAVSKMSQAIRVWMVDLQDYPGWRDWQKGKIGKTMNYDDPFFAEKLDRNFTFSDEIERQHAVVIQFLGLQHTIHSLRDCEFYFRRYPFRYGSVSRGDHILNICEMYFARFYEFKTRLKNFTDAINQASEGRRHNFGSFIKQYDKAFDQELRMRNQIHHHRRFDDVAIDRLFLVEAVANWERRDVVAIYRVVAKEWALRVRKQANRLQDFLEVMAAASLTVCKFLR